jgi:cation transporter-like permease
MFVIVGLLVGAIGGGLRAKARGGKAADIAQYAFVHGLMFALLGLFITIYLDRMLRG